MVSRIHAPHKRRSRRPFWRSAATLLALTVLCATATAQTEPIADPQASLDQAVARLEALGEPQNDEDREWQEAITERIDLLQELLKTIEQGRNLTDSDTIAARRSLALERVAEERAKQPVESITLSSGSELADYESRLTTARTERDDLDTQRRELRARRQAGEEERQRLARRASSAQQRIEKGYDDTDLGRYLAQNASLDARVVRSRTTFLTEAVAVWSDFAPVVDMELEAAEIAHDYVRNETRLARTEAARLREEEAQRARAAAEEQVRAARAERDPIERFKRGIQAEIASRQAEMTVAESQIEKLKIQIAQTTAANDELATERRRLERRLDLRRAGADELLRLSRDSSEHNLRFLRRATLPALDADIERNQQQLADLLDRLWGLQIVAEENPEYLALLDSVPEERHAEARAAADEVVGGSEGLIITLRAQRRLLETTEARLAELSVLMVEQQEAFVRYIDYLDSQLIWIRSDLSIGIRALGIAGREITDLVVRATSPPTWSTAVKRTARRPLLAIAGVAMIVLLLVALPRLARIALSGQEASELRLIGLRLPRRAALVLWSVWLPMTLMLAARLLKVIGLPGDLDPSVPHLLELLSGLVLARNLNRLVFGPAGAATSNFQIRPEISRQLFRSVDIALISAMAFWVPHEVLRSKPFDFDQLPRMFETAWMMGAALAMILLIRPGGAWIQFSTRPGSRMRTAMTFIGPLWMLIICFTVVLGVAGYRLAAKEMLANDFIAIVTLLLLRGFFGYVTRWSQRLTDKVRARVYREGGEEAVTESSEAIIELVRRLAILVTMGAAAFVLLRLSGAGVPGVRFLEGVNLIELESGSVITLWDVCLAIFWIAGGHLLATNLGNLYEQIIMPLAGKRSGGAQFALLTISRYVILLVAYSAALLTLNFSPASLGWIVTAASVGLGFGLQEIVANFISGLILLFEQPIRVGDIITVGTTGGTVERINIRATVVTNWEKQTIIVPNKNFITQNVTNWTRNDRVMRRILKIRVKYGENVEKVLRLLDDAVGAHPKVLDDPAHRIWFNGFGDYGLEFEVFFYTAIEDGLSTRTDLYALVYDRLQEEGIEIPLLLRQVQTETSIEEAGTPATIGQTGTT